MKDKNGRCFYPNSYVLAEDDWDEKKKLKGLVLMTIYSQNATECKVRYEDGRTEYKFSQQVEVIRQPKHKRKKQYASYVELLRKGRF